MAIFSLKLFWRSLLLTMIMTVVGMVLLDGVLYGVKWAAWTTTLLMPLYRPIFAKPTVITVLLFLVSQMLYGYLLTAVADVLLRKMRGLP